MEYFPQGNFIMKRINSCYNLGSKIDVHSSLPDEFRSAAKAVLTWHMTDNVMTKLEELNPVLIHTFRGNIFLHTYFYFTLHIVILLTTYIYKCVFCFRCRNENRNRFSLYGIIGHWCESKIVTRTVVGYFKRNAFVRNEGLRVGR